MTQTNDPVSQLDVHDRLCLEIGRVTRSHVQLDQMLREVHQALATPGLAIYLTNGVISTDRLVENCKLMLEKVDASDEFKDAAKAALAAAKDANRERNRVVHDMWMPAIDEEGAPLPGQWQQMHRYKGGLGWVDTGGPRDVADVRRVGEQFAFACVQVFALHWGLLKVLPFYKGGDLDPTPIEDFVKMMWGHIKLMAGGGFRLDEPPNGADPLGPD